MFLLHSILILSIFRQTKPFSDCRPHCIVGSQQFAICTTIGGRVPDLSTFRVSTRNVLLNIVYIILVVVLPKTRMAKIKGHETQLSNFYIEGSPPGKSDIENPKWCASKTKPEMMDTHNYFTSFYKYSLNAPINRLFPF